MRPSPSSPPPNLDDFPSSPSSVWSCYTDDLMDPLPGQEDIQVCRKNRTLDPFDHRDRAADNFLWEASHPAIVDPTDPNDPSRYSLLIHEISLLVGLAPDDLYPSPNESRSLVSNKSKQVPNNPPLTPTPTKSLASHRHRNTGLAYSTDSGSPVRLPVTPTPRCNNACTDSATSTPSPFTHQTRTGGVRPSPPHTRRQGQVFHFDPQIDQVPLRDVVDPDETFVHPREPPPKPTPSSPSNRCSSLDRLEHSLLKLEAHAPYNHRKSQSEGRSSHYVDYRKDRRPSLPPPRRLKKEHSGHELSHCNLSRPIHAYRSLDPPVPSLSPPRPNVVPKIGPVVPLDEDRTPGSFMDMDILCAEETSHGRKISLHRLTSKEKVKNLVRAAKTASRELIAWGKNLAGSSRSSATGREAITTKKYLG